MRCVLHGMLICEEARERLTLSLRRREGMSLLSSADSQASLMQQHPLPGQLHVE